MYEKEQEWDEGKLVDLIQENEEHCVREDYINPYYDEGEIL